ncbi:TPA: hypothetical protein HA273_07110 [Candidatus Bathyarchaeota archaeon]|nr:hypothetical protein [Candidatus Bathyarchaeota archaeon]HIJ07829.1 hypothetical protein [Candidatus Bathyarchaeota archaeon]
MEKNSEDKDIKRMAELLRKGATLTDLTCPACASPLFRFKDGTLWCGKDEKKVIIAKEGDTNSESSQNSALDALEITLTAKVQEIQGKIKETESVDELQKLSSALSELLDNLAKIKKMKS